MDEFNAIVTDNRTIEITTNTHWSCKAEGNFKLSKYDGSGNTTIEIIIPEDIMSVEGNVYFTYGNERCEFPLVYIFFNNECYIRTVPSYITHDDENSINFYYEDSNETFYVTVYSVGKWKISSASNNYIANENDIMFISSDSDDEFIITSDEDCLENNIHVRLINKDNCECTCLDYHTKPSKLSWKYNEVDNEKSITVIGKHKCDLSEIYLPKEVEHFSVRKNPNNDFELLVKPTGEAPTTIPYKEYIYIPFRIDEYTICDKGSLAELEWNEKPETECKCEKYMPNPSTLSWEYEDVNVERAVTIKGYNNCNVYEITSFRLSSGSHFSVRKNPNNDLELLVKPTGEAPTDSPFTDTLFISFKIDEETNCDDNIKVTLTWKKQQKDVCKCEVVEITGEHLKNNTITWENNKSNEEIVIIRSTNNLCKLSNIKFSQLSKFTVRMVSENEIGIKPKLPAPSEKKTESLTISYDVMGNIDTKKCNKTITLIWKAPEIVTCICDDYILTPSEKIWEYGDTEIKQTFTVHSTKSCAITNPEIVGFSNLEHFSVTINPYNNYKVDVKPQGTPPTGEPYNETLYVSFKIDENNICTDALNAQLTWMESKKECSCDAIVMYGMDLDVTNYTLTWENTESGSKSFYFTTDVDGCYVINTTRYEVTCTTTSNIFSARYTYNAIQVQVNGEAPTSPQGYSDTLKIECYIQTGDRKIVCRNLQIINLKWKGPSNNNG